MKRNTIAAFAFVVMALFGFSEHAQAQLAIVVASCPPARTTSYPVGTQAFLTVDVNGVLCNSSSGTPYQYKSAGVGQYAVAITSLQTLTIPSGSLIAEVCVETAAARYTTTGTTPTSTVGQPVVPSSATLPSCFQLAGAANLTAFQIIGAGATMDVEYFK